MDIGGKIRELREKKSLTMKQLSEMVPCTPSLISQIERGKADPSISTLKKIATALNANIVDFFSLGSGKDNVIVRAEQRAVLQLPRWDARIQCLTTDVRRKRMQPFYTVIKPGGGSHGPYAHEGEEFGIILKGEMELMLGSETYILRKDDSFYFSSTVPHDWNNRGKEDCVVVWVITPPTF
jgi:transcriptional regulator with XRE-family HTH domain